MGTGLVLPPEPSPPEAHLGKPAPPEAAGDTVASLRARLEASEQAAARHRYEVEELLAAARALASERDVRKLLATTLATTRQMTGADAGSVYVIERETDGDGRLLHFMLCQNDSIALDLRERTLPVDGASIVGAAVLGRTTINIADLYALEFASNPGGFRHDRSFDLEAGYQTRSILTVPMLSAHDEVIGVLQLINRKRNPAARLTRPEDFSVEVVPFDAASEQVVRALAAQAGVSLENALLYKEVRELFDGFVRASVTAIEARDPTTSGHSQRVAILTVALAKAADRVSAGPLAALSFSADALKQIEYAALLHDFGKVGVREQILTKPKKLYEHERRLIEARFDYIRKSLEADALRRHLEGQGAGSEALLAEELAWLDRALETIDQANEPTVLPGGSFEALADISAKRYRDARGQERPCLGPDEVLALSLPRGTLTELERVEIESHVIHTFNFLRKIPWGQKFRDLPRIAATHHEKLDGSGYPFRLTGDAIPVEARMMTIADIFDALTASDRPYKKAMPADQALAILEQEVRGGKCDRNLFDLFVQEKVYAS